MLGDAIINMTAGMILGMVVCPIMMKAIKNVRQNIRVNRILREISDTQKAIMMHFISDEVRIRL